MTSNWLIINAGWETVSAGFNYDDHKMKNFQLECQHYRLKGLHPTTVVSLTVVKSMGNLLYTEAQGWALGWIKFLETIASHGAWSGWVETLAKAP